MTREGSLVLVVGPSGAGKDTLIRGAQRLLADAAEVKFPHREITRANDHPAEDAVAVTAAEFAARERAGWYVLSWQAHGLFYGVPISILEDLRSGRIVVLNVSRAVVKEARALGWRTWVAQICAPTAIRRQRLIERAREVEHDLNRRLRDAGAKITGVGVFDVPNDGAIDDGVRRLIEIIERGHISRAGLLNCSDLR